MSARLQWANDLKAEGARLGREGMSLRVLAAVKEFDGSYKGAMVLAGRLKAISQMAAADGYWREKVEDGYHRERNLLTIPNPHSQSLLPQEDLTANPSDDAPLAGDPIQDQKS